MIQEVPWSHPFNSPRCTSLFVTGSSTMVGLDVSARVWSKLAGISLLSEDTKKPKQNQKSNQYRFLKVNHLTTAFPQF